MALVTLLAGSAFAQPPGLGETRPVDPAARERAQSDSDRAPSRCAELAGTARDDCLRGERAAAAGATRRSEPPTAPPPQNPR